MVFLAGLELISLAGQPWGSTELARVGGAGRSELPVAVLALPPQHAGSAGFDGDRRVTGQSSWCQSIC